MADETLGPCGCIDYHMADCPIRTAAFEMPDEGSWEEEEGRGFDGYEEDD